MVDWYKHNCYWFARVIKVLSNGKVQVALLMPPAGEGREGDILVALCKELRPKKRLDITYRARFANASSRTRKIWGYTYSILHRFTPILRLVRKTRLDIAYRGMTSHREQQATIHL